MKFKNRKIYFDVIYRLSKELFYEFKYKDSIKNIYLIEYIISEFLEHIDIAPTEDKAFWRLELESRLINLVV